jgi:hypothetical protein
MRLKKTRRPNAYEKVVDRLLQSPHYGERMAMQWLDFARYADSHGFQTDSSRSMWPWREWVIRSFNDNKPFNQFTIEQIAGDLLPNATLDQKVATGFNRNHRINGEGGIIGEEWRIENIIDRVETTGFTWLALSLNCCRCHDHKYDPITPEGVLSASSPSSTTPPTAAPSPADRIAPAATNHRSSPSLIRPQSQTGRDAERKSTRRSSKQRRAERPRQTHRQLGASSLKEPLSGTKRLGAAATDAGRFQTRRQRREAHTSG